MALELLLEDTVEVAPALKKEVAVKYPGESVARSGVVVARLVGMVEVVKRAVEREVLEGVPEGEALVG